MKIHITTFVLSLLVQTSFAQVTIGYCQLEGDCKFYQTQYSYKDLDAMFGYMGTFEKDKGTLVFFKNKQGQDVHYPDVKRSLKELHAYFGGKGEPSISKGGVALPFNQNIQPLDGNWQATTGKPTLKNCPAQLADQAAKIANVKDGKKTFSKPFTPNDMLPSKTAWVATSPNNFKAYILPEAAPSFKTIYEFTVKSPTLIIGVSYLTMNIPGQNTCEVSIPFNYQKK